MRSVWGVGPRSMKLFGGAQCSVSVDRFMSQFSSPRAWQGGEKGRGAKVKSWGRGELEPSWPEPSSS